MGNWPFGRCSQTEWNRAESVSVFYRDAFLHKGEGVSCLQLAI
ncbi:hypothetical protein BSM4216_0116 [Bacillus smithii]|nr:hypothetical protein BSM4216_0116 [Bacillus smithii]